MIVPVRRLRARRSGFILAIALFALLIISALSAMLLLAVSEDAREGRVTALRQQALAAAESAMYSEIVRWDSAAGARAQIGRPLVVATVTAEDGRTIAVIARLTRLDSTLYQVTAEATVAFGRESALQRVAMSVKQTNGARGVILRPLAGQGWAQLY